MCRERRQGPTFGGRNRKANLNQERKGNIETELCLAASRLTNNLVSHMYNSLWVHFDF